MLALFLSISFSLRAQQAASPDFSSMDRIMAAALQAKKVPGAVILVGHDGQVVFEKAYGNRATIPAPVPMTDDTIFDMASMTKVMATTTAAMQLYQQGRFRLNDPVATYLPAFAANGKGSITIRQVMTH
jgi:CubicO group peptidase (beta-lactamase class C family)